MPSIVTLNVSLLQAPTPNTLQQTGALISQGATTKAQNTLTLLTQVSDLTAILAGTKALSNLTWATNTVTATTTAPHGYTNGDTVELTIAGAAPAGYNGSFLCTITGASTFTYPLAVNPGTMTTPGTYTPEDVAELLAMATTYFAQGTQAPVYVLELGQGGANDGVATLTTYLQTNPLTIYAVCVPRTWDANANFLSLIASYEAPTGKFYFFVTTTTTNYTSYTALMKDVFALIEAPGIPALEFSVAGAMQALLRRNPSNTNRATPFAFTELFGVTPYPTMGNGALLTALKAAGVNVIGTGAEGGESNTILLWGTTMDVRDFAYWYSLDWVQIQTQLNIANEVINGSNNNINPLDYDQDGINRLEGRLVQVMKNAVTFGLAVGTVTQLQLDGPTLAQQIDANAFSAQAVVNAVPFVTYTTANPGDYKIGRYNGLSIIYIPQRGFISILINILASDFVTF